MYRSPQCMICGNLVFFWSIMGMPNYYLTTKKKSSKNKNKNTPKIPPPHPPKKKHVCLFLWLVIIYSIAYMKNCLIQFTREAPQIL